MAGGRYRGERGIKQEGGKQGGQLVAGGRGERAAKRLAQEQTRHRVRKQYSIR